MINNNGKIVNIYKADTGYVKVIKGGYLHWQKAEPVKETLVYSGGSYGQSLPLKPSKTYRFEWNTSQYGAKCEIGYRTGGNVTSTSISSDSIFKTPADCDLVFTYSSISLKIFEITGGGGVNL